MCLFTFLVAWITIGLGEATFGEAFLFALVMAGVCAARSAIFRLPGRSLLLIILLVLIGGGSS